MIDTNAVPKAWNPGASIESLKPLYWLSMFQFGIMYWNNDWYACTSALRKPFTADQYADLSTSFNCSNNGKRATATRLYELEPILPLRLL